MSTTNTESQTRSGHLSPSYSNHKDFQKEIRQPDEFYAATTSIFDLMAKNSRMVIMALIALVVVIAGASWIHSRNTARNEEARNVLFVAEKAMEKELKALQPATPPAQPAAPAAKAPQAGVETVLYTKMDVDSRFPETVAKLKAVAENYRGTRSAFEAQLILGRLYFDHQEGAKALPWLVRAIGAAPNAMEKQMTQNAVAHVQEDLGKFHEAAQDYESILKDSPQGALKAEVLLGLARTQESLHDIAKAKGLYDQVISQMPGTEYSKTAQVRKAQLEQ